MPNVQCSLSSVSILPLDKYNQLKLSSLTLCTLEKLASVIVQHGQADYAMNNIHKEHLFQIRHSI